MRVIRRGRTRRFRAQMAVFWIAVFTTIAVCMALVLQDLINQPRIARASEEINAYKMYQVSTTAEENALLKEKLERSMTLESPTITKELVRAAIRRYFPQSEWATAEKISTCESGMNNLSVNDKNKNGSTDRGAWQINSIHAKRFEQFYGVKWELGAHDIELSTKYAKFLYDHSSWGPWVCSKLI